MWVVYQHVSPSGKIYIGITSNIKSRWKCNGYYYCSYNSIMKKVINKYGWDNIKHEILHSDLTYDQAVEYEKYYISKYKKEGISYNITDGGQGTSGRKLSEGTKRKMRASNKGVSRKAIEASIAERTTLDDKTRVERYASYGMLGKHHTESTKLKMAEAAKGRDMTKAVEASIKLSKKPIVAYKDGILIGVFESHIEASKILNVDKSNIGRAIRLGIRAGGYNFQTYVS